MSPLSVSNQSISTDQKNKQAKGETHTKQHTTKEVNRRGEREGETETETERNNTEGGVGDGDGSCSSALHRVELENSPFGVCVLTICMVRSLLATSIYTLLSFLPLSCCCSFLLVSCDGSLSSGIGAGSSASSWPVAPPQYIKQQRHIHAAVTADKQKEISSQTIERDSNNKHVTRRCTCRRR